MPRTITILLVLAGMFTLALLKILLCLCSPEVTLHLILAWCHAVMNDLFPLPQFKQMVPVVIVVAYVMFALVHFMRNLLRQIRGGQGQHGQADPPDGDSQES